MNTISSAGVFIATAILIMLLVAMRFVVRSYGHRIGVDDVDLDPLTEPDYRHSRYATLQKVFTIASVVIGVWIVVLGAWMTWVAWGDYSAARRLVSMQTGPAQIAAALGMLVVLVGAGLIVMPSMLRWNRRPENILTPRPAFKISIDRSSSNQSKTDFSALMQASGDTEKLRPAAHWYSANLGALWIMLVLTILVVLCYLAVFILVLPMR